MASFLDKTGLQRFKVKLLEAVSKGYLGKNDKATSALQADSVTWSGITNKPKIALSVNGITPDNKGNVNINAGLDDVLKAANMAISNNLVNTGQVDLATVLNTVNELNAEYQRLKEMLNGAKFIIETGNTENGWYRKWSDGWIEQGGYQPNTGNGNHYFDFPIPFTNMNYTVVASAEQPKNQADANAVIAKETTSRVYIVTQGYGYKSYLYACGY